MAECAMFRLGAPGNGSPFIYWMKVGDTGNRLAPWK